MGRTGPINPASNAFPAVLTTRPNPAILYPQQPVEAVATGSPAIATYGCTSATSAVSPKPAYIILGESVTAGGDVCLANQNTMIASASVMILTRWYILVV